MEVAYYEMSSGRKPAKDYIDSLPIEAQASVYEVIEKLEAYGTRLGRPYSAPLRGGILELRARVERN